MGSVALWHVGSSLARDQTRVSCIGRRFFTREALRVNFYILFSNVQTEENAASHSQLGSSNIWAWKDWLLRGEYNSDPPHCVEAARCVQRFSLSSRSWKSPGKTKKGSEGWQERVQALDSPPQRPPSHNSGKMSHRKKTDRRGSLCQCLFSSWEHLLNYCIDGANNVMDFKSSFPRHPYPHDGSPDMNKVTLWGGS